jgi:hypothetical protein
MTRYHRKVGRRLALSIPAVAACLFPILTACSGSSGSDRAPVVVIGIDGMTWGVAEPLMKQGRLPNLAKLVDNGVAGVLQTDLPTYSPILWTSIGTGVQASVHGIRYFSEVNEKGQILRDGLPYTSNCRKVPAIWNMAGEGGRSVNSVAWWVSWPAEDVPGGNIVASYAAQAQGRILWKPLVWEDGIPRLTFPESLQERIAPQLEAGRPDGPLVQEYNTRFGTVPQDWEFAFELDRFFRGVFHSDRTHQRIFRQILEEEGIADLNLVYFGLADVSGHYFWRYRQPDYYDYTVPADQVALLGSHIDKAYEQLDAWLGEILAELPEDATIMVVSDHGMVATNAAYPHNKQSGGHDGAPPGAFVISGPDVVKRGLLPAGKRRLGGIYDITPTLLHLLDLPSGGYMFGKPLRRHMTEAWQLEHPAQPDRDWRQGFRAATPPLIPGEGLDQEFMDLMAEIGYTGSDMEIAPSSDREQR